MPREGTQAWEQAVFDRVSIGLIRNSSEPYQEGSYVEQMVQNLSDEEAETGDLFDHLTMTAGSIDPSA